MAKSISDLKKELVTKERMLQKLSAKRDRLADKLSEADKRIAVLLGRGKRGPAAGRGKKGRRGRKRGRKGRRSAGSLGSILEQVMRGKGSIKVKDAVEMVLAAGYKTKSKQFGNIVSQTLKADKRFRRVRRGLYKVAQ